MTVPFLPGELELLQAINGTHSPFWDAAMWLISNFAAWIYPGLALLFYLFWRKPTSEALLLLLCVGLCIALGDLMSSGIAKPFFARLRPTHSPWLQEGLHYVYGYHGGKYGFFSGHSANYTSVATLLCLTFRDRRFSLVLAVLVGWVVYSRMYLGAHFLSDCLVGIAVGLVVAQLVYRIYLWLRRQLLSTGKRQPQAIYRPGLGYLSLALAMTIPLTLTMALQVSRIVRDALAAAA